MNQLLVGKFIAQKRKEKNLTQEQLAEMLKKTQNLKSAKTLIIGYILIIMGGVMLALSRMFGGTDIRDFFSGVMLGLSIGEIVAGTFLLAYYLAHRNKREYEG